MTYGNSILLWTLDANNLSFSSEWRNHGDRMLHQSRRPISWHIDIGRNLDDWRLNKLLATFQKVCGSEISRCSLWSVPRMAVSHQIMIHELGYYLWQLPLEDYLQAEGFCKVSFLCLDNHLGAQLGEEWAAQPSIIAHFPYTITNLEPSPFMVSWGQKAQGFGL